MSAKSAAAKAAAENAAYRAAHPDTNWAEVNTHMGTAWKQDPGYKAREELFPMPWNHLTRSSGVPVSRLSAQSGVTSTFVRPNAHNNAPFETRYRTFENNFMNRIDKLVIDCLENTKPINLELYAKRLQEGDCSRDEAILLYDELMAIFITFMLYIIYISKIYDDKIKANPSMPVSEITKTVDKMKLIKEFQTIRHNVFSQLGSFGIFMGVVQGAIAGGVGATFLPLVVVPITIASAIFGFVPLIWADKNTKYTKENLTKNKDNLFTLIQLLVNVMFDTRNTHSLGSVRENLKYWGLTKAQVDYFFTVNPPLPEFPEYYHTFNPGTGRAKNLNNDNTRKQLQEYQDLIKAFDEHKRVTTQAFADKQALGHKVFGAEQISEFIRLTGENPKVLAPNGRFPEAVVRLFPGAVAAEGNAVEQGPGGGAGGPPAAARQGGKRSHKRKTHKKRTQKKRK